MKSLLILAFALLVGSKTSSGSHLLRFEGVEWSYKSTPAAGVYIVTLKCFRDCSLSTAPCSGTCSLTSCSKTIAVSSMTGTVYGTASLRIKATPFVKDITGLCPYQRSICTEMGCSIAGSFSPGFEEYVFEDTLNLNLFPIPASTCNLKLGYSDCCSNAALSYTTLNYPGFTSWGFYSECMLNRCLSPANNSPVFLNPPVMIVCAGRDISASYTASDPDGDSLSYHFEPVYTSAGTAAIYNSPYTPTNPFPYAGSPARILDSITGEINYRPTGSFAALFSVVVKEWRRVGGVPVVVGTISRQQTLLSQVCSFNSPPLLKTYTSGVLTGLQPQVQFNASAGTQLCFTISAADSITDSTDISWSAPPEMTGTGAAFLPAYSGSRNTGPRMDSFNFCWTPPVSAARQTPYYFTVTARDRFCPLPGHISKTFGISVNAVLPVRLLHFEAISDQDHGAVLFWTTAAEQNNKGFFVQKSTDADAWMDVAFIKGHGTTNHENEYSCRDAFMGNDGKDYTFYYRLKQVDNDGHFYFSNVKSVNISTAENVKVYPNPVKDHIILDAGRSLKRVIVELRDMKGQTLYHATFTGYHEIDAGRLQPDNYVIECTIDGKTVYQKLIKVTP